MSLERRLFPRDPQHAALLRMLMTLDGSTTRACEAVAQAPMEVLLLAQAQGSEVPDAVHEQLGGSAWLTRVTSLHAHGQVMMDAVSFTRLDVVPAWFLAQLNEGSAPIGHMLQHLFVRREPVASTPRLEAMLWSRVGLPDDRASRCYRIATERAPLMMIFEVFRAGMVGSE
ncbi:MAG TPA: chorismate pyruvate-lyase family protein [Rhizobacter sp.]|jgi:chorismate-pyruvate lyase|nr:chorismate pyruvate-lyase family protein [Rhizobacter sp.]